MRRFKAACIAATLALCMPMSAYAGQADWKFQTSKDDATNQEALARMENESRKANAKQVKEQLDALKAEDAREAAEAAATYAAAYYGGGSTATTLKALLNGQGRSQGADGTTYTWYPHDIGNGPLHIPGEKFDKNGVSHDKNGYIVVASDDHPKGTVIKTPYGKARVYDSGAGHGNIDIYTRW